MARRKIVAYKVEGVRGSIKISAMTESPRGTRVLLAQRDVVPVDESREAFKSAVATVIEELQAL